MGDTWRECVDPVSGRVYYFNACTKQTSWACPAPRTRWGNKEVAGGWTAHCDKTSGKTYYFNKETRQTSWVWPPKVT